MNTLIKYKGAILPLVVGLASFFLSAYTPSAINSVLIALVIGIVLNNLIALPTSFDTGISFTSGKLLEISLLFLAFDIDYRSIASLGIESFGILILVVFTLLITTYFLSIKLKCPGSTGWLVGFGTAICGSSAIAALSPSVSKNKEDVAISMAVVNLLGTLGMILLPFILLKTDLGASEIGLIIGGSLHSVGNVAGAGYSLSPEAGEAALTFKLARVALLSPALIFFNYLVNRNTVKSWKEHFRLPWYLIGFILITIISSTFQFPESMLSTMEIMGKIILTIAMAAIGLKVNFQNLIKSGRSGLLFGVIIFAIQLGLLSLFLLF